MKLSHIWQIFVHGNNDDGESANFILIVYAKLHYFQLIADCVSLYCFDIYLQPESFCPW